MNPLSDFYQKLLGRWKTIPNWLQWTLMTAAALLMVIIGLAMTSPAAETKTNSTFLALDVFFKLAAVLALIWVCGIALRRWKSGSFQRRERQLSVMETLSLSPRRSLVLVKAGGRMLLVGATDQTMTLISDLGLAPVDEAHASFDDMLTRVSTGQPELNELETGYPHE